MQKQKFKYLDILTFKKLSSMFAGNYKTSFHGSGMEIEEIRMYSFSDDVKNIDWLSTAKHDKVYIKKYIEERELPSLFLFNLGGTMQSGFGARSKIETSLEAFMLLSLSSLKNGDSVGSVFYDEDGFEYMEGRKGQLNLWKTIKRLEAFKSENTDIGADIGESLKFLFSKKIKNNIIFILTDELKIENHMQIKALCKKNDVIFIHISDSFENKLNGSGVLSLGNKIHHIALDLKKDEIRTEYLERRNDSIQELKREIISSGGSFITLDDKSNLFKDFYSFFKMRQKTN